MKNNQLAEIHYDSDDYVCCPFCHSRIPKVASEEIHLLRHENMKHKIMRHKE